MATEFITIIDCCEQHHIETSFLYELRDAGLVEITLIESTEAIHLDQLNELERYIRWHYELGINTEGIETVRHLLDKITNLQRENRQLQERLKVYL